ncbi:MAG: DUF6982 domain-containing protein [Longimicrobiales bacterium]
MSNQVVARYRDGRVIKGTSLDLDPAKPVFHLRPPGEKAVEIRLSDLKALFFVRSLDGDAARNEDYTADPTDPRARGSTLVKLSFHDGEVMLGHTIRYPPNRPYFYITPVDTKSNNIRVLINRDAVASMETTEITTP